MILQQFPVATIKTSVPELFPKAKYCLQGEKWVWDGVTFEFLSPTKELLGLDNNSSCVLRVTIGNKHILFTGDIEKLAEKSLVENQLENLPSTILIAPHHGSKTSANEKFIRGINPQVVLFPNVSVVKKYKDLNVVQYETDKAGAIKFVLQSGVEMVNPELYRINHKYYWNN
jgi:competence protein ComEC